MDSLVPNRPPSALRGAMIVAVGAALSLLAMPAMLWAQFDSSPGAMPAGEGVISWEMPIKIAVIVVSALVVAMVCYFVLYPTFLKRGANPVWPLTLFGRCSALAWFLVALIVLGVLWDDLVWIDEFGGTSFWREHGGRLGVFAAGIVFAVVWLYLWRSDVPKPSDAAQLSQ